MRQPALEWFKQFFHGMFWIPQPPQLAMGNFLLPSPNLQGSQESSRPSPDSRS